MCNRLKMKESNQIINEKYNKDNHIIYFNQEDEVPVIKFQVLEKIPFIKHGFSTKLGGVSTGDLATMNLSFHRGDMAETVTENYRRICEAIGLVKDNLVFSDQVHDIKIHKVIKADMGKGIVRDSDIKEIDGLITNEKDIPLVTFYADCVPLYFVDPVNKAIGLTHSGWKGTVRRIGNETVKAMKENYNSSPDDIIAVIGPSICRDCYEVSEDVANEFRTNFKEEIVDKILEEKENGKYQLDLWLVNKYILMEAGIKEENITISSVCTCCNHDILFSHRATKGKRGNLAAFLSIS
ncbi:peptidoglycan editing factor PgeF [Anaeromicropila herbilytica]|uniref:Purine nucleoside phosphorylase n=1 Tax=Anaeromicropila herbilytica TaxID=2785025 RepID=A0A7R7IEP0_9FIRM|nr:peptidoglycan editing factor PgeF [Anaeromicropila herbilytica]BCN31313.1 laccase domain protein [Anaeromicropila herbilytica]